MSEALVPEFKERKQKRVAVVEGHDTIQIQTQPKKKPEEPRQDVQPRTQPERNNFGGWK